MECLIANRSNARRYLYACKGFANIECTLANRGKLTALDKGYACKGFTIIERTIANTRHRQFLVCTRNNNINIRTGTNTYHRITLFIYVKFIFKPNGKIKDYFAFHNFSAHSAFYTLQSQLGKRRLSDNHPISFRVRNRVQLSRTNFSANRTDTAFLSHFGTGGRLSLRPVVNGVSKRPYYVVLIRKSTYATGINGISDFGTGGRFGLRPIVSGVPKRSYYIVLIRKSAYTTGIKGISTFGTSRLFSLRQIASGVRNRVQLSRTNFSANRTGTAFLSHFSTGGRLSLRPIVNGVSKRSYYIVLIRKSAYATGINDISDFGASCILLNTVVIFVFAGICKRRCINQEIVIRGVCIRTVCVIFIFCIMLPGKTAYDYVAASNLIFHQSWSSFCILKNNTCAIGQLTEIGMAGVVMIQELVRKRNTVC